MKIPHSKWSRFLALAGIAFLTCHHAAVAIPVFPGAVGFGTNQSAPPGRNGTVYKVTTLADTYPTPTVGSLRWAVNQSGARVIVFEVSGVIDLQYFITVDHGNVTIAGQTAPPPGITLKNYGFIVRSSNVLVQHIASRPGTAAVASTSTDSFNAGVGAGVSINNIVFDHVSASWNTDETAAAWGSTTLSVRNVTYINSIFSEAIRDAMPSSPHGGFGPLAGRNCTNISFVRNIFGLIWYRNPLIRDTITSAQVVDNFIYRPGTRATDTIEVSTAGSDPDLGLTVSAIGNVIIRTPNASGVPTYAFYVDDGATTDLSVFLSNNRLFDPTGSGTWYPTDGNPYGSQIYRQGATNPTELGSDPHTASGVISWGYNETQLEAAAKQRAGKHPAFRDAIDATLISKINARTGAPNKTWPELLTEYGSDPWDSVDIQNTRTLTIPANPHVVQSSGYTTLEEWLHLWSAQVEGTLDPLVIKGPDDFEDGNANGWTVQSGTWGVALDGATNDVYRQTNTTVDAVTLFEGTDWTDYSIEARVKIASGNLASLYARHKDVNNYYTFMLLPGSSTVAIKKRVGTVTTLTSATFPVALNTWYTLKLDVSGNTLKGYVDGALVLTTTDSSHASGRAALSTYLADASFDDVVATPAGMGVAAPSSLLASVAAAPDNINQINLTWTDNAANETGFKIERRKGSGGTYTQIGTAAANATSYNDTTCGAGTQYYYRVRAYNGGGNSSYSSETNATTAEVIAGRQGHWKLNETSGSNANDETANNNDGTLTGFTGTYWVAGKIGNGLSFDGTSTSGDDKVNAQSGSSVDNLVAQGGGGMTVAAWIKADSTGENSVGRIVAKATGPNPINGWQFVTQSTNKFGFTADYTTTDLLRRTVPNTVPIGTWCHVVATWTGSATATTITMYVNGTALSGSSYEVTQNGVGTRNSDATASLVIGNDAGGASTFDGVIDDVRVYNRVLTAAEITAIHRAGL